MLSLALVSYDRLWTVLGVARDQRAGQSTGLAVLCVCIGFLVAVYIQQCDFHAELIQSQAREFSEFRSVLPASDTYRYYTGTEAMALLVSALPTARVAKNTRILSPKLSETSYAAGSPWDLVIRQAVAAGLTFREVVSRDNEALARDRLSSSVGGTGRYEASILLHSLPSFLNFIVLEKGDGSREVWFGWVVSRAGGFEDVVVRAREDHIVRLFEKWHSELFQAGRRVAH
ncbi:MAG TPA: hypothetical protein VNA20_00010 [Frankiaceae bacterium]|nr:hypothetical protein [Frankiaceae bacterium]